jgi:hypothetical protein
MLIKLMFILVILIGLGFLGLKLSNSTSLETLQVALDEATKTAIEKGEFIAPEGVTFVEPKDCEGTQWIKQSGCSLDGKEMDGSEGSCGAGKELWILDPEHPNFKPATGGGKCEPQERECSVPCPKPCEGDTWIDTGKCVRKEYDTKGNMVETVLDGTEGKCGEGITQLNLDTKASDYKPAVGTGSCPTSKGGYCNVPCPKPEPPKCNNYTGWVENTGLGCVANEGSQRKVACGQKGKKMFFNVATNPKDCPELTKWEDCTGAPCPVDCVGTWSDWSNPKSDEPCGVQPYKERTFTITTQAAHGGNVCDYPHGDTQRLNSGTIKTCCEETGDWAMVGACNADGTAKYTQTYKENKVGGCPSTAKAKFMACCFQKGDWTDTTGCSSVGRKTQKQTTANCPDSVKTRQVDCPYVGPWIPIGGCTPQGKQYYRRDVVNSGATTSKTEDCCYTSAWTAWGTCQSNGKQTATRSVTSACTGADSVSVKEQTCCYEGNEWKNIICNPNNSTVQRKTLVNCSKPYVERTTPSACNYQKCSVQTWKHGGWHDHTWTIRDSLPNVSSTGSRHDEISSYAKYGSCKATAYEHKDYGGWGYTLQGGRHGLPGWANDKISSIKIEHLPYNL